MADSKISALSALTSLAATDALVVASSGASKKILATGLPGALISYDEKTTDTAISSNNAASPNTVITATAATFDGAPVWAEFGCSRIDAPGSTNSMVIFLMEGATNLGRLTVISGSGIVAIPVLLRRRFTPSAASHTYSIAAYCTAGSGTVEAGAGGGSGIQMPVYLQFTKA